MIADHFGGQLVSLTGLCENYHMGLQFKYPKSNLKENLYLLAYHINLLKQS